MPQQYTPIINNDVSGLIAPGNIDLNNRPLVSNDDGSVSSEYSTSFGDDQGREILVPTVVNGKFLTPDGKKPREGSKEEKEMFRRAQQRYEETGQHMGIFKDYKSADAYAEKVHQRPQKSGPPMYVYGTRNKTMADGPQDITAPLNSNPMPSGMAPAAAPPPQAPAAAPASVPSQGQQGQAPQGQAQQPNLQQSELGRLALIGHAVGKLMGGSTTGYSINPQTGETVPVRQPMTPGQWGRSMVLGAMLGLAANDGNARGGKAGGFLSGFGKGGAAVTEYNQRQDQMKLAQAQQQYQNQLKAQENQRAQEEEQRKQEGFKTDEARKKAEIAQFQMATLAYQQQIQHEDVKFKENEAAVGRQLAEPYALTQAPIGKPEMTGLEIQKYLQANPTGGNVMPFQVGNKVVVHTDGTVEQVPTFNLYDASKPVTLTKGVLDAWKTQKDDLNIQAPGLLDSKKPGDQMDSHQFAAVNSLFMNARTRAHAEEEANLKEKELNNRIAIANAELAKVRAEIAKQGSNLKASAEFDAANKRWEKAGGTMEDFQNLPVDDRMAIGNGALKMYKEINDEAAKAVNEGNQELAKSLLEEAEPWRNLRKYVLPSVANNPVNPDDETTKILLGANGQDPDKAKAEWNGALKETGNDRAKATALVKSRHQQPPASSGMEKAGTAVLSAPARLYSPSGYVNPNPEGVQPPQ